MHRVNTIITLKMLGQTTYRKEIVLYPTEEWKNLPHNKICIRFSHFLLTSLEGAGIKL